jgi:hypothetical protein
MSDRQSSKELKQKEITCQLINWPKQGKPLGSIKTSENEWFGVEPSLLKIFNVGEVCQVEYTETPKKQGDGVWLNIKRKVSSTPTAAQKAPYIAPKQRTDDRDQEQITVRLIMDKKITVDSTWVEIAEIMQQARKVYRMTWMADKPENPDINDDIPY